MKTNSAYLTRARKLTELGLDKQQRRDILVRTMGLCNVIRGYATDCLIEELKKTKPAKENAYLSIMQILENSNHQINSFDYQPPTF